MIYRLIAQAARLTAATAQTMYRFFFQQIQFWSARDFKKYLKVTFTAIL